MNRYFLEILTTTTLLAIVYLIIRIMLEERTKAAQAALVANAQKALHEADTIVAEHVTASESIDSMRDGSF